MAGGLGVNIADAGGLGFNIAEAGSPELAAQSWLRAVQMLTPGAHASLGRASMGALLSRPGQHSAGQALLYCREVPGACLADV